MPQPTRILMICTGNICRSPLAECVLRHKANARGMNNRLHIDSAGVGDWHSGEPADQRVLQVAAINGVPMTGTARQITRRDITYFDWLICMDRTHQSHVLKMGGDASRTKLLLEFDPHATDAEVPDPYYGGIDGFHAIHRMIDRACEALLDHLDRAPHVS